MNKGQISIALIITIGIGVVTGLGGLIYNNQRDKDIHQDEDIKELQAAATNAFGFAQRVDTRFEEWEKRWDRIERAIGSNIYAGQNKEN